jgi:hypothetical protein
VKIFPRWHIPSLNKIELKAMLHRVHRWCIIYVWFYFQSEGSKRLFIASFTEIILLLKAFLPSWDVEIKKVIQVTIVNFKKSKALNCNTLHQISYNFEPKHISLLYHLGTR